MTESNVLLQLDNYPVCLACTLEHDRAARYAKQFGNHWKRHADVLVEDPHMIMVFTKDTEDPYAVSIESSPTQARFTVYGYDIQRLERVSASVTEHLLRFAGNRDTLVIGWTVEKGGTSTS
jgi:hypothetical protein